jgi:hypothetical protein
MQLSEFATYEKSQPGEKNMIKKIDGAPNPFGLDAPMLAIVGVAMKAALTEPAFTTVECDLDGCITGTSAGVRYPLPTVVEVERMLDQKLKLERKFNDAERCMAVRVFFNRLFSKGTRYALSVCD